MAMSIENASRFVTEAHARDGKVLALFPWGLGPEGIGSEEIAAIAKAANAAGWELTAGELQEAYLETMALDEGDLSAAAGGETVFIGGFDRAMI